MKIKLPTKFANKFDRTLRVISKHSPEIYMGIGTIAGIGCVAAACYATLKEEDIIDEAKAHIDDINAAVEAGDIEESEKPKKLALVYGKAAGKTVLNYAPAIGLGLTSGICTWKGFGKMKKTAVTATAMYTAEHKKFNEYRERLIEKFDENVDKELYLGLKEKTTEEEVTDEKGKTKRVTKTETFIADQPLSMYARIFDDYNDEWRGTNERSLVYILDIEEWANNKLKARLDTVHHRPGYLYLNEVYEALGFRGSEAGSMAGWIYDPEGYLGDDNDLYCDHRVSFGIFDKRGNDCHNNARFLNDDEHAIWLDFNVHGYIGDKI